MVFEQIFERLFKAKSCSEEKQKGEKLSWTWDNIEEIPKKNVLVLKCKVKCSYAYIKLEKVVPASMSIRAQAYQMIVQDAESTKDVVDSSIESDESVTTQKKKRSKTSFWLD